VTREDRLRSQREAARIKRLHNTETLKRRRNFGYVLSDRPKGIQHWYTTRHLVNFVTENFDCNEKADGRRVCYINRKWQLQIRGKHLRRLLKAMPNVKCHGSFLVEERNDRRP
jgi:hypothetical protein